MEIKWEVVTIQSRMNNNPIHQIDHAFIFLTSSMFTIGHEMFYSARFFYSFFVNT